MAALLLQPAPFSLLALQGLETLSTEQAAEIYQLATESAALGSDLAKWFQAICGLKATHCAMEQTTTGETVLSSPGLLFSLQHCLCHCHNHPAGSGVGGNPAWAVCKEANKVWKAANDVIFLHLMKYDAELASFLTSTEGTLQNKHEEI